MAAVRTIPQRELRNNISAVLREVEQGTTVRVTVNGRAVADLVPVTEEPGPRTWVPAQDIRRAFAGIQADADFERDIEDLDDDDLTL